MITIDPAFWNLLLAIYATGVIVMLATFAAIIAGNRDGREHYMNCAYRFGHGIIFHGAIVGLLVLFAALWPVFLGHYILVERRGW